jgi:hypothetical protein
LGTDGPIDAFRTAERKLRQLLLGDGSYEPGQVRGEEARARVSMLLRQLHAAFDDVVAQGESGTRSRAAAEARAADLEDELNALASSTSRSKRMRRSA